MFRATLPNIARPYAVPAVTLYGVGSWKSTHEKVVLTLTALDCSSKASAEPPLTA